MEVVEFNDCIIIRSSEKWPDRKPFSLNGTMYVVEEWRMSMDEKVHWHKLIDQQTWQGKY